MEELRGRSFRDAIEALNGLITKPRSAVNTDHPQGGQAHLQLMFEHLKLLGLEEAVSKLSIIHVAGTKGKGSTCAFVERILRASGFRTALFTSPHLLDIRERIRLNGELVSEELFTEHFCWCWDQLQTHVVEGYPMARFFRFMTLMALKIFTSENVDVVILEVGLGGLLDATNVIRNPAICGIASLGYDHMELLGNTLGEIATQKAGIFKEGVPAVTVPQHPEAMESLKRKAEELKINLEVAPSLDSYNNIENLELGLKGEHQRVNAALAVALCKGWAERSGHKEHKIYVEEAMKKGKIPSTYLEGLTEARWPGRGQVIKDESSSISFYLDGAHSPESMEACAKWFCADVKSSMKLSSQENGLSYRQVLLFNCMPKRDPQLLLPPLLNISAQQGIPIDVAVFVPPFSSYTSMDSPTETTDAPDVSWQRVVQQHWETLKSTQDEVWFAGCKEHNKLRNCTDLLGSLRNGEMNRLKACNVGVSSAVMPSLPTAIDWLRRCSKRHPALHFQVLVTGSLYLVADVMRLLTKNAI